MINVDEELLKDFYVDVERNCSLNCDFGYDSNFDELAVEISKIMNIKRMIY